MSLGSVAERFLFVSNPSPPSPITSLPPPFMVFRNRFSPDLLQKDL